MVNPLLFYRPEIACPDAGPALCTEILVDHGRLFLLPGNGLARAGLKAKTAHLAFLRVHLKANQRGADQGRTVFLLDVLVIFMTEMADG